jgi:hypothetical protein
MRRKTPENLLSDKNGQQITKGKKIKNKIPGHSLRVQQETSKTSKITQEPGNEVKANTLLL